MKWLAHPMGIIGSRWPHQENLVQLVVQLDGASDRYRKLIKRPREMRNTKVVYRELGLHIIKSLKILVQVCK